MHDCMGKLACNKVNVVHSARVLVQLGLRVSICIGRQIVHIKEDAGLASMRCFSHGSPARSWADLGSPLDPTACGFKELACFQRACVCGRNDFPQGPMNRMAHDAYLWTLGISGGCCALCLEKGRIQ